SQPCLFSSCFLPLLPRKGSTNGPTPRVRSISPTRPLAASPQQTTTFRPLPTSQPRLSQHLRPRSQSSPLQPRLPSLPQMMNRAPPHQQQTTSQPWPAVSRQQQKSRVLCPSRKCRLIRLG